MTTVSWVILAGAALIVAPLLWKLRLMQRAADEIGAAFCARLTEDSNVLIDISCRDRHMRRLAETVNAQLRLLRSQRLRYSQGDAELKAAVTNISHDLRTPLTAILGYLELLKKEPLGEKAAGYAAVLENRARALEGLTEELFQYSLAAAAGEELRPELLSLNAALEENLADFYTALRGKGIEPELTLPPEPVRRELDKAALNRVIGNILSNAARYSGGDLAVTLTREGRISFENRAPGLDKIQTERLFERFYTVESARRSTGLGLSIAKLLTERMGGAAWADYENGRLRITVEFPPPANER